MLHEIRSRRRCADCLLFLLAAQEGRCWESHRELLIGGRRGQELIGTNCLLLSELERLPCGHLDSSNNFLGNTDL